METSKNAALGAGIVERFGRPVPPYGSEYESRAREAAQVPRRGFRVRGRRCGSETGISREARGIMQPRIDVTEHFHFARHSGRRCVLYIHAAPCRSASFLRGSLLPRNSPEQDAPRETAGGGNARARAAGETNVLEYKKEREEEKKTGKGITRETVYVTLCDYVSMTQLCFNAISFDAQLLSAPRTFLGR